MGSLCKKEQHSQIEIVLPQTDEQKMAMKKPYIYKPCPGIYQLQIGKQYSYCACGLSKSQPFCDNSHIGTKFEPIKFVAQNRTNILCLCKQSKTAPFCDNSHRLHMNIEF